MAKSSGTRSERKTWRHLVRVVSMASEDRIVGVAEAEAEAAVVRMGVSGAEVPLVVVVVQDLEKHLRYKDISYLRIQCSEP